LPWRDAAIGDSLAAQLGLRPDQVTDSASLVDLGADSLDTVEFIMSLEEHFKLEIPDEGCKKLLTVDDSVAYIKARLQQMGTSAHP
jgi:acyl carrier protein